MQTISSRRSVVSLASACSRRGFTLVELLVVIAIIAILATLLFPAIKGLPARANTAKCVSNLRQIGAGFAGYVGDNNGELPWTAKSLPPNITYYWHDQVIPYIDSGFNQVAGGAGLAYWRIGNDGAGFDVAGNKTIMYSHPIFDCPGLPNHLMDDEGNEIYKKGRQYKYNARVKTENTNVGMGHETLRMAQISQPSRLILVIDREGETYYPGDTVFSSVRAEFRQAHIFPHNGHFNAMYADGHVATESKELINDESLKNKLPWANAND